MSKAFAPPLGHWVQNFFCQHLQAQRQVSPHTLASYRDTLRLLLAFVEQKTARHPSQQTLGDWNAQTILSFLDHLEKQRGCQARTRNVRLAALRTFMRYVSQQSPETLALTSQVLAIPLKRFDRPLIESLSEAEVRTILAATNLATASGRRDHLLFNFLYYTGRASRKPCNCDTGISIGEPPSPSACMARDAKSGLSPCANPSPKS